MQTSTTKRRVKRKDNPVPYEIKRAYDERDKRQERRVVLASPADQELILPLGVWVCPKLGSGRVHRRACGGEGL